MAGGRWRTPAELLLLGAIWGGSFLFLRVAAPAFGPVPLTFLRLALGAVVLAPFLWRARTRLSWSRWPQLAAIGALNSAIPFALFAWSAERAPAGVSAIINSMAVPFAALAAFLLYGEQVGRRRMTGLVVGLVGVGVLAAGDVAGANIGPAVAAGALAALFYGVSANLVKHHLGTLPPVAVAAATLVCGTLMLAPFAVMTWPASTVPARAWLCAAPLGLVCTGVAYALYFRLIQRIGAPRATTVTYLVPVFGVLWAWLALGESLTLGMLVGGLLILGGMGYGQGVSTRRAARIRQHWKSLVQNPHVEGQATRRQIDLRHASAGAPACDHSGVIRPDGGAGRGRLLAAGSGGSAGTLGRGVGCRQRNRGAE